MIVGEGHMTFACPTSYRFLYVDRVINYMYIVIVLGGFFGGWGGGGGAVWRQ